MNDVEGSFKFEFKLLRTFSEVHKNLTDLVEILHFYRVTSKINHVNVGNTVLENTVVYSNIIY